MNQRDRRVTFQDDDGAVQRRRRCVGLTQRISLQQQQQQQNAARPILKSKTPISLHGRVLVGSGQPEMEIDVPTNVPQTCAYDEQQHQHGMPAVPQHGNIRESMYRRSAMSNLSSQVDQFQKIVSYLEDVARQEPSVVNQTASWRVRNLITSAQSIDKHLWEELFAYEKTLMQDEKAQELQTVKELRKAQTSCMKLHRDFKRLHRRLIMCLSVLGEVWGVDHLEISSQLGSVGWLSLKSEEEQQERTRHEQEQQHMQHQRLYNANHRHAVMHTEPLQSPQQAHGAGPLYPLMEERDQYEAYEEEPVAATPRMIITRKMAQRQTVEAPPEGFLEPVYHEPPYQDADVVAYGREQVHEDQFPYPEQQPEPSIFTGLSTLSSPSGIHQRMNTLLYEQFDDFVRHNSASDEDEEELESNTSIDYDDDEDDDYYRSQRNRRLYEAFLRRLKRLYHEITGRCPTIAWSLDHEGDREDELTSRGRRRRKNA